MSHCRSCGAPVVWCTTTRGKRIPLDGDDMGGWETLLDVPDGTIRVVERRQGEIIVQVLPQHTMADERHYRSHFETCPDAEDWRKR